MAENIEKSEAEILEESMASLELENSNEEITKKNQEDLENSNIDSDEDLINIDKNSNTQSENLDEIEAIQEIDLNNQSENSEMNDGVSPAENIKLEEKDNPEAQKKESKLHKILIIILGLLFSIVLIGAVIYFMGYFDPEEKAPTKEELAKIELEQKKKDEYKFSSEDIDSKRLNNKLNLLTKYEIVENPDMEAQKKEEREKLYIQAKKELEEEKRAMIEKIKEAERKRLEEELPKVSTEEKIDQEINKVIENNDTKENSENVVLNEETKSNDNTTVEEKEETTTEVVENKDADNPSEEMNKTAENENTTTTDEQEKVEVKENVTSKQTNNENVVVQNIVQENKEQMKTFIKIVKISTNKKDIYKSYLDDLLKVTSDITLCRDDKNLVEIFIGPFEKEEDRVNITKEFKEKLNIEAEAYDYTEEEYNKRCKY